MTTSLKIDYLGAAQLGEWIEAAANFLGIGRDLALVNCYIYCGECGLVCANGVYEAINLSKHSVFDNRIGYARSQPV